MKKVIATSAIGTHVQLLDIALPSLRALASAQGYSLVIGTGHESGSRPASWGKVPLLRDLVDTYDVVFWIDVDVVVMRTDRDPLLDTPPSAFQAFVEQTTSFGKLPNCGIWLIRGGAQSAQFLDEVWKQEQFIDHPWWEQAAVSLLLGRSWVGGAGPAEDGPNPWATGTGFLPPEWNAILPGPGDRIRHYAGRPLSQRRAQMRADAAEARGDKVEAAVRRLAFRMENSARYRLHIGDR